MMIAVSRAGFYRSLRELLPLATTLGRITVLAAAGSLSSYFTERPFRPQPTNDGTVYPIVSSIVSLLIVVPFLWNYDPENLSPSSKVVPEQESASLGKRPANSAEKVKVR